MKSIPYNNPSFTTEDFGKETGGIKRVYKAELLMIPMHQTIF